MSKKTRKEKEVSRLRREVEILRAELATGSKPKARELPQAFPSLAARKSEPNEAPSPAAEANSPPDQSYLKKDLLRTFLLSLAAFLMIFSVYLLQTKFSQLLPDFLKA